MTLTITATLLLLWNTPTAETVTGPATYYDAGLMEQVAVNRGYIDHVNAYSLFLIENNLAGLVALERAADVGRRVWIDGDQYLVADCRGFHHFPGPFVVEFGHRAAARRAWPQPAVRVTFEPPEPPWPAGQKPQ